MRTIITSSILLLMTAMAVTSVQAENVEQSVIVNVENFARAETSAQFDRILEMTGGINQFVHLREPTPLDKQNVIRMNRDTLYSAAVVDISKGATLTVPDSGTRYMSIMLVNEDHYINRIIHKAGVYNLTVDEFDTPYLNISVRTLLDASDSADIQEANALQDQIEIEAASANPYTHPNYDVESYQATYEALLLLGKGMTDTANTFGKKEDVDQVRHLLGTAWGWGGLPEDEAFYLNVEPALPVGEYQLTVKDVPVDAFWSISLYNGDGYFQENEHDSYSVNSVSATPNEDGSVTVNFGGDPENPNFLYIMEGWNYTVRLYQPSEEILDGSWKFPDTAPMK